MKQAVIFALEKSNYEPGYEKMAILLVKSIIDTNPDIDVYCGLFTNRAPSLVTLGRLEAMGVKIITDVRFKSKQDDVNYFLRNYCCYHFSHEMNLLEQYDRLTYLDIDVIVLGKLDFSFPSNGLLVERVPDHIVLREKEYIGDISSPLYYNWVSIVTNDNKHIFDIDYSNCMYMKQSDIAVSKKISESNLTLVDQNVGAYYPKHTLSGSSVLFHYDGFIDSGSFYRLEEYNPSLYKKYAMYVEHGLGINLNNDRGYWDGL